MLNCYSALKVSLIHQHRLRHLSSQVQVHMMSQLSNVSNDLQEDLSNLLEPIPSNSNSAHVEMAESTLTKVEESLSSSLQDPKESPHLLL